MAPIFFVISPFILFVYLFFREIKLDHKRFLEADRLADEHVLREVERFKRTMGQLSDKSITK
jgi:hypothetical protein